MNSRKLSEQKISIWLSEVIDRIKWVLLNRKWELSTATPIVAGTTTKYKINCSKCEFFVKSNFIETNCEMYESNAFSQFREKNMSSRTCFRARWKTLNWATWGCSLLICRLLGAHYCHYSMRSLYHSITSQEVIYQVIDYWRDNKRLLTLIRMNKPGISSLLHFAQSQELILLCQIKGHKTYP